MNGNGNGYGSSNGSGYGAGNGTGGGNGSGNGNGSGTAVVAPAMVSFDPSAAKTGVTASATAPRAGLAFTSSQTRLEPMADLPKTLDQKLDEFYGVKQIGDEVLFAARFEDAKKVLIAGDFNNWSPMSTPMVTNHAGSWKMQLPLQPGRYRYRFVVDGRWVTDPNNTYVETNQFGELNNVVDVVN